ncbi:protein of unknown function [Shinella sp. WSC3-e]|nr:hypothetical protein SHINE37_41410 [Rhizobiaceae bacterium]CAK7256040.1 protein of unknown function [Shinella sp. WSC3-e]
MQGCFENRAGSPGAVVYSADRSQYLGCV